MKILVVFLGLAYFLFEPAPLNKLTNKKWVLFKVVEQHKIQIAEPNCNINIQFDSLGNYFGFSGWNNFKGTYSLKSNEEIGMTTPSRTKKGGQTICKIGESLYPFFAKTTTFTINKDTLTLQTFDNIKIVYLKK